MCAHSGGGVCVRWCKGGVNQRESRRRPRQVALSPRWLRCCPPAERPARIPPADVIRDVVAWRRMHVDGEEALALIQGSIAAAALQRLIRGRAAIAAVSRCSPLLLHQLHLLLAAPQPRQLQHRGAIDGSSVGQAHQGPCQTPQTWQKPVRCTGRSQSRTAAIRWRLPSRVCTEPHSSNCHAHRRYGHHAAVYALEPLVPHPAVRQRPAGEEHEGHLGHGIAQRHRLAGCRR